MRILIFNTFYFPKFIGGAEVSVQLLAEGLVKKGNEIFVITFGEKFEIKRVNGVVVIRVKQRNIYSSYTANKHRSASAKILWHLVDSFNPLYLFFINVFLKRIKPDVIHTNNIMGFSPSLWAVIKFSKIPIVHTIRDYYLICHRTNMFNNNHSCDGLCKDCKITHSLKSGFMQCPDYFVGISKYILNRHNSIIGDEKPRSVVYNGVKTNHNEISIKLPYSDKLTFGYMGRISTDKGVEYMVKELAACAPQSKTKFKVMLAGRGENDFINKLNALAVGVEIEFVGVVKPEAFFRQIDVLIVPSLWPEPFGRTVIEALSFGVPVCISDSGGLTELHDDISTWLYAPEESRLTQLIENIVNNQQSIELKKIHCLSSAQRFNEIKYIEGYQNIYETIKDTSKSMSDKKRVAL
ncbi:glycosyltransferase family 4 protein [Mucilaginibacter sp.]|uniref:glycosyltransferase family 4 protein n=1 Tax=Mucilaginibacter sp. TaxID=1882438 RepID=UPI0025F41DCC|nr:glycosyltransferase family 4 protein [Mucilaginibacter sp.]